MKLIKRRLKLRKARQLRLWRGWIRDYGPVVVNEEAPLGVAAKDPVLIELTT